MVGSTFINELLLSLSHSAGGVVHLCVMSHKWIRQLKVWGSSSSASINVASLKSSCNAQGNPNTQFIPTSVRDCLVYCVSSWLSCHCVNLQMAAETTTWFLEKSFSILQVTHMKQGEVWISPRPNWLIICDQWYMTRPPDANVLAKPAWEKNKIKNYPPHLYKWGQPQY